MIANIIKYVLLRSISNTYLSKKKKKREKKEKRKKKECWNTIVHKTDVIKKWNTFTVYFPNLGFRNIKIVKTNIEITFWCVKVRSDHELWQSISNLILHVITSLENFNVRLYFAFDKQHYYKIVRNLICSATLPHNRFSFLQHFQSQLLHHIQCFTGNVLLLSQRTWRMPMNLGYQSVASKSDCSRAAGSVIKYNIMVILGFSD